MFLNPKYWQFFLFSQRRSEIEARRNVNFAAHFIKVRKRRRETITV